MFYPNLGCTCGTWDHIHEHFCGKPEPDVDDDAGWDDCGVCGRIYVDSRCPEHGNLEPPVAHEASVQHRGHGWKRWRATCPCGYTSWWTADDDAHALAIAHSEGRMR